MTFIAENVALPSQLHGFCVQRIVIVIYGSWDISCACFQVLTVSASISWMTAFGHDNNLIDNEEIPTFTA